MAGMFGASSDAAFLAALGTQSQQPTTTTTEPSQQPRRGSKIVPSLPIATMPAQPEEGTGTPPPPPAGTAPPPLPPPLVAPSPAKTLGLVAAIASDPVFAVGDRVAVPQHGEGTVRFYGQVHFQAGIWAGVELDSMQGRADSDTSSVPASPGIWESPAKPPASTKGSSHLPLSAPSSNGHSAASTPAVSQEPSKEISAEQPAAPPPPSISPPPPVAAAAVQPIVSTSTASQPLTTSHPPPLPPPVVAAQSTETPALPPTTSSPDSTDAAIAGTVLSGLVAAPMLRPEALIASLPSQQQPASVEATTDAVLDPLDAPPINEPTDAIVPPPPHEHPIPSYSAFAAFTADVIEPPSADAPLTGFGGALAPPASPPRAVDEPAVHEEPPSDETTALPTQAMQFFSPVAAKGSDLFGAAASFDWNTFTVIPPPGTTTTTAAQPEGGEPTDVHGEAKREASEAIQSEGVSVDPFASPLQPPAVEEQRPDSRDTEEINSSEGASVDPFASPQLQEQRPDSRDEGPSEEINLNDDQPRPATAPAEESVVEEPKPPASAPLAADAASSSSLTSPAPASHDIFGGSRASAADPFSALFSAPPRPSASTPPVPVAQPTASASLFGGASTTVQPSKNTDNDTRVTPQEAAAASMFGGRDSSSDFFAALSRPPATQPTVTPPARPAQQQPHSTAPTSNAFTGFGATSFGSIHGGSPLPSPAPPAPSLSSSSSSYVPPPHTTTTTAISSASEFDSIPLDGPTHIAPVPVAATTYLNRSATSISPTTRPIIPPTSSPAFGVSPLPPPAFSVSPLSSPAFSISPLPSPTPPSLPAPNAPSILTPATTSDAWRVQSAPAATAPPRKIQVFNPAILTPHLPPPTPAVVAPPVSALSSSHPLPYTSSSVQSPLPTVSPPSIPSPVLHPGSSAPPPPVSLRAESLNRSGPSRVTASHEVVAPARPPPGIEVFDPTRVSRPSVAAPQYNTAPPTPGSMPAGAPIAPFVSALPMPTPQPPSFVPPPPLPQMHTHGSATAPFSAPPTPDPSAAAGHFTIFDPSAASLSSSSTQILGFAPPPAVVPSPQAPIRHRPPSEAGIAPHPVVAFGFGGKITLIFPSTSSSNTSGFYQGGASVATPIRVASLRTVLGGSKYVNSLASYPGPLSSSSSKDAVIKFINERAAAAAVEGVGPVADARRLLWEVLRVAIKHYGNLGPTKEEGEAPAAKSLLELLLAKDKDSSFIGGGEDVLLHAAPPPSSHSEGQVLAHVQQLMMMGKTREAWKATFDAGLWSHALLLSRCVDEAAYQASVAGFAASSLPDGSPLRSFYLVVANSMQELARQDLTKTPQQRAALLDRWQENLAILLANRSKDSAVLGRLGDVLWSRYGCVEAAHLCYLTADHAFQSADNPNARLVLLGGDHKIRKRSLFTAETLQRTEILEFSRRLANSQYNMATLAPYKLLYAMQLADLGLLEQAHQYLQVLMPLAQGKAAASQPPVFVQQVNLFAHRMSHLSAGLNLSLTKGGRWNPLSTLGSLVGRGLYAIIGDGEGEEDPNAAQGVAMSIPPPSFDVTKAKPARTTAPPQQAAAAAQRAKEQVQPPAPAKPKETPKPAPTTTTTAAAPKAKEKEKEKKNEEGSEGGWGWNWFGRRKVKNPVHLGKRMDDIEYDNELKMYVKKGTKEPAFASAASRPSAPPTDAQLGAVPAAPPLAGPPSLSLPPSSAPFASVPSSPISSPQPQPGTGGASQSSAATLPVTTSAPQLDAANVGGSRFSRFSNTKARSRYYDASDPAPAAPLPTALAPALMPMAMPSVLTPAAPALFTPTAAPTESTYEAPDFYAPPPPAPTSDEPQQQQQAEPEPSPVPSATAEEPPAIDNSWLM